MVVRQTDPGYHACLAVLVRRRYLRCVKVEAVVQIAVRTVRSECQCLVIHLSDEVYVMIGALAAARKLGILRGENEYVFSVDVFYRRALPHTAEALIARDIEFARELPAGEQFL